MATPGQATATITLESRDEALLLFGSRDQFLRMIRDALEVRIIARGDTVTIEGNETQVDVAERVFVQLRQILKTRGQVGAEDVKTVIAVVQRGGDRTGPDKSPVLEGTSKFVRPRTDGQARYLHAMRDNDLILCVGPAGSGKTYLAVGMAVTLLRQGAVKRIVLVRPAVEAGERLGFLPGDIVAKVNPYLRPLLDSLNDILDFEQVKRYQENDIIEIAPLAFMRGRAQPLTSKVLTQAGFRPIGSLQVGDEVIGSDGQPARVEGVFPQGVKDIFRVTFTDRAETRCCGEHLWAVYTPEDLRFTHRPRILQTKEMIGRLMRCHQHRYAVPILSRPVKFPAQDVPLDPYALGLLLGDGCMTGLTTPTFATADTELVEVLGARVPGVELRHKGGVDYVLNKIGRERGPRVNPLTHALRDVGLWGTRSNTKFIPDRYLFNSAEVRLGVLQGLMDTDGGPVTQAGRTCRIQYVTTSPRLRDDVVFLVRSLGGVAYARTRPAEGRKPGFANGRAVPYRSDAYVLDIRLPTDFAPFQLTRKAARYEEHGAGRPMRFIHRIEPDGQEEAVCISVAAADSLYVTDDFLLTHNTLNHAVIILDEGQNTTIPQMKMFLTRMGMGSKIIVTGDVTQSDLPKQTRSGMLDAIARLDGLARVAVIHLSEHDIVRHPLVQQIVRAYEHDKVRKKT